MSSEEERLAADKALEEAIDHCAKVYGEDGLLMEWMVITSHHYSAADHTATTIDWFTSNELPFYRTQGLLEFTRDRLKDTIREALEGQ